jgi:septal ring factor EnvC (AmiA/AmiB activator)
MMFTRRVVVLFLVLSALLLMLAVGCGPKPPCPVTPGAVKQAQAETEKFQSEQAATEAEIEELEKELAAKQAELEQLRGKPEELEKRLEELKKGSGRD